MLVVYASFISHYFNFVAFRLNRFRIIIVNLTIWSRCFRGKKISFISEKQSTLLSTFTIPFFSEVQPESAKDIISTFELLLYFLKVIKRNNSRQKNNNDYKKRYLATLRLTNSVSNLSKFLIHFRLLWKYLSRFCSLLPKLKIFLMFFLCTSEKFVKRINYLLKHSILMHNKMLSSKDVAHSRWSLWITEQMNENPCPIRNQRWWELQWKISFRLWICGFISVLLYGGKSIIHHPMDRIKVNI